MCRPPAKRETQDSFPSTPRPPFRHELRLLQRYNIRVAAPDPNENRSQKQHRHSIYATETTGLLVIAFLLLILIILRYWHDIHWSLR